MNKKAQISMEYLLVAGFAFLSIVPIIIIFFTQSQNFNQDVTLAQADKVMSEIIDAADTVFYQGAPSTTTIRVSIPNYVDDVVIDGSQSITFVIKKTSGPDTFNATSRAAIANLTGGLDFAAGLHTLRIQALNDTFVNITDMNR
jgi:uncharacterized protein (UPF0333 family)